MSKIAANTVQTSSTIATPSPPTATSSWIRGPPPAATSNTSSNLPSATSTPTQPAGSPQPQAGSGKPFPNGASNNDSAVNGSAANASAPMPIGGHTRKGSMMVGGGMDIKRGSIAFGTVDSPNPLLSSSPAAPSATGAHLADTVKSFGSIDADTSTDANAVKATRRASTLLSPSTSTLSTGAPAKHFDMHAMFGAKPQPNGSATNNVSMSPSPNMGGAMPMHDRRQSFSHSPGSYQGLNGLPNSHPYQMPGMIQNQNHLRPPPSGMPGQPRSPVPVPGQMGSGPYNGQVMPQLQQGFRPPQQAQQGMMQPNGSQAQARPSQSGLMMGQQRPGMMMGQQGIGAYGMHPGPQGPYSMMGYPQQPFYAGYSAYEPQQYGVTPQWAPQQHPQNQSGFNMSLSPRPGQSQLGSAPPQPSPSPHGSALPSSGGPSPMPTPPTRPPSLMGGHQTTSSNASFTPSVPSTPARPGVAQNGLSFAPQAPQQSPANGSLGGLSVGASAFTPRATKAIKISRPDGTAFDLKQVAAAAGTAKPDSPSVTAASEVSGGETPVAEPIKKKLPTLPVIVRLESEDQKKARLEEEARKERIRKEEEAEDKERKERKERIAREEEERKVKAKEAAEQAEQEKADKAKADADAAAKIAAANAEAEAEAEAEARAKAKQKAEDDAIAEQAAIRKAAEEHEAVAAKAALDAKAAAETKEKEEAAKAAAVETPAQEAAKEKLDANRTLSTPSIPPLPASPTASPASTVAGLPPKPSTTTGAPPRRAIPAALELNHSSPSLSEDAPMSVPALSTARPIEDISSIIYPGSLKSPNAELNLDASPGKFRYDREFLMQFMDVCREKPENLPPLEEIGLEAESSSGFGSSRNARGSRPGTGPTARGGAPTGLGIGGLGSRPAFTGQGMGTFAMGNFTSSSITRGTTSEERYNRSLSTGRAAGGMTRTPSQAGPSVVSAMHGLPAMSGSSSRGGVSRSQRGTKRLPQDPRGGFQFEPEVAPLVVSNNAWTRPRNAGDEEGSPAYVERKVKALLNKLTAEKFDTISQQVLEWANKSEFQTDGMALKLVIKQIFEKATDEAHWSPMYARLCRLLLDLLNPAITEVFDGKPVSGGLLFRKYLLGRCQLDFEAGWKAREEAATAAAAKSEEDKERLAENEKNKDSGEAAMLSDEYYVAQKAKRRGLGLVQLIGELFKLDMIGKGVIKTCFQKLLQNVDNPDEEDIESTCKLLTTVGEPYERVSPDNMVVVFERLQNVKDRENVPSRIKFMIMDLIDLRKGGWSSRTNQASSSMTIAEVHQQAAREQSEKAAAAAHSAVSRGGSRAGHGRRDGPQPGEWQAVPAGARPLQRPSDFSGIGRNISTSGTANPISFGPSSVFAKRKTGVPGVVTPPLSRQASTSNMFGVLRDEPAEPIVERRSSAEPAADAPQRVKLKLQPRTVPVPGQDGENEAEGEGVDEETTSEDEVSTPADIISSGMSSNAAETKITADMKELWGEKDAGGSRNPADIVEYFKALPGDHQPLLAVRLVDDVFRIAKPKDAEVVAKGWSEALEQGVTTSDILTKGLEAHMASLDDDSIDFPQAYKAIAILMRSISLSAEDINTLMLKIDIDGEPKITPRMKIDRAFAALDDEAVKV